ncbi:hypothetical protein HY486_02685 [Candidatus Woesearchaeota archaeon]|nr:hypothetical protein [Candidatus Woesearchaeota archaeon]
MGRQLGVIVKGDVSADRIEKTFEEREITSAGNWQEIIQKVLADKAGKNDGLRTQMAASLNDPKTRVYVTSSTPGSNMMSVRTDPKAAVAQALDTIGLPALYTRAEVPSIQVRVIQPKDVGYQNAAV